MNLALEVNDITKIERIVAGADSATFTADVDDNGSINVLDITKAELAAA